MRNDYPGTCYRCGERVEVGAGHFQRGKGKWLLQHASCAIKYRGTSHKHDEKAKQALSATGMGDA